MADMPDDMLLLTAAAALQQQADALQYYVAPNKRRGAVQRARAAVNVLVDHGLYFAQLGLPLPVDTYIKRRTR